MRVVAAIACLLALAAYGGVRKYREQDWLRYDNGGNPPPLWLLAPSGNVGMGTECADADVTTVSGAAVTITRASAATCIKSDGTVVSISNNKPVVQSASGVLGLVVQGSGVNLVLHSRDLSNAAWTKTDVTCTKTATGTDGVSNVASTCTASAGNGTVLQGVTVASSSRSTSLYLKRRTGTGTIEVTRDNGATWVDVTASVGASWVRVTPATHAGLNTTSANPTVGIRIATNGDAVDVDRVQDEAGGYASNPIDTAGTSVTRAATQPTATNPLQNADANWCVKFTAVPLNGRPWRTNVTNMPFVGLGTSYASANTLDFYASATTGNLQFSVWDSVPKEQFMGANAALSGNGSHTFEGCTANGSMGMWLDGVAIGTEQDATAGATGIISTQPATVTLGYFSSLGFYSNTILTKVCIENRTHAASRCP